MGLNPSLIPSESNIFVDSNIFLYVFLKHPAWGKSCHEFIRKIESKDIIGYTDEFVLNEVFHKLMITAIVNQAHCSPQEAVLLAKKTPEIVKDLTHLWEATELLKKLDLRIISGPFYPESYSISHDFGLLATDSVHVAAMRKEKITRIASNDADFARIPLLEIWRPGL